MTASFFCAFLEVLRKGSVSTLGTSFPVRNSALRPVGDLLVSLLSDIPFSSSACCCLGKEQVSVVVECMNGNSSGGALLADCHVFRAVVAEPEELYHRSLGGPVWVIHGPTCGGSRLNSKQPAVMPISKSGAAMWISASANHFVLHGFQPPEEAVESAVLGMSLHGSTAI